MVAYNPSSPLSRIDCSFNPIEYHNKAITTGTPKHKAPRAFGRPLFLRITPRAVRQLRRHLNAIHQSLQQSIRDVQLAQQQVRHHRDPSLSRKLLLRVNARPARGPGPRPRRPLRSELHSASAQRSFDTSLATSTSSSTHSFFTNQHLPSLPRHRALARPNQLRASILSPRT